MSQWMGSIRGRRKALLFVTPSLELLSHRRRRWLRRTHQARAPDGRCNPTSASTRWIREGLYVAPIAEPRTAIPTARYSEKVYIRIVDGGAARACLWRRNGRKFEASLDGARFLAEESGGFAVVNTNGLQAGLDRIVRDNYRVLTCSATTRRTRRRTAAHARSMCGSREGRSGRPPPAQRSRLGP